MTALDLSSDASQDLTFMQRVMVRSSPLSWCVAATA